MLRFHDPYWLLLLLIIPIIIWNYFKASAKSSVTFSDIDNLKKIKRSRSLYYRHILLVLQCLAVATLILALARPQKGKEDTKIITEGVDIIITVDTSGSMRAEDLAERGKNRLHVVKEVVNEFIKKRKDDRIGLIVYGEDAYTQCPLTLDYGVLLKFLSKCKIGMAGENSTSIGDAIATSVLRLEDSKAKSKIVVLLTDGRNNSGLIPPETAAEMARSLGVKIYTIGAGTKGVAPMPARDFFGNTVYRKVPVDIDENLLMEVATVTSGKYFRATNKSSLKKIYSEINKLEKTKVETFHYMEYSEKYINFALAAGAFIILNILLINTRFRKLP